MLWYLLVCSMIGGISVSVTTGLGSAIVTTARGDNQFKHWFIYFLLIFITLTLCESKYLLLDWTHHASLGREKEETRVLSAL